MKISYLKLVFDVIGPVKVYAMDQLLGNLNVSMELQRVIKHIQMLDSKTPKIRVLVRKRPMNKKQLLKGETDIVTIQNDQTVIVKQQKLKVDLTPYIDEYKYNFDGAYDEFASNQYIYETAVRPLVDCAFDGAKVTCFAYGQTGSGKTHTMLGNSTSVRGLYILASQDIFKIIKSRNDLEVWISFYEIYCGKLYDLLNDKNILFAREDSKNNVNIVGLSETKISNSNDLMEYISYGTGVRVTSQNGTNNDSSRSHAILQIALKRKNKLHGKISFIDLAGSERAADHADQLQKQTRIDGAEINKSLLALKECIRALDQNKHHTPFRGSKLTMVLKDSFTGYCRTVMIGNIAPNSSSSENTLNTLKYADRVKELKKAKEASMEADRLMDLEKELMLPRNGFNINPRPPLAKTENEPENLRQNSKGYGNKSNFNPPPAKPKAIQITSKPKMQIQQQKPERRKSSPIVNPIKNMKNNNNPVSINNFIGASQPPQELNIATLSEKHDEYIELILEQEQKLIKEHQVHINETIELTKREMQLRNDADKIGSNIQDYLDNLQGLLQHKISSILSLKKKIVEIKGYLKESKTLQQQYAMFQKQMYQQQQQDCQVDDDEQLFV